MKKGLVLLLVVVLLVGTLVACGGSDANDEDSQVEATSPPITEEQPTPAPIEETNEPEDNEVQVEVQLNLALVGTWRDDTITIFTRVFNEDGTGSSNTDEQEGGTGSEHPFAWRTTAEGELILSYPWGEEHFTYSINGDTLTLTGDFAVSYIRE